jgi:hypothetical protein
MADPAELGPRLAGAGVSVSVLALAEVPADSPVMKMALASGGRWLVRGDAATWTEGLAELVRASGGERVEHSAVSVGFDPLLGLGNRTVGLWNRTWLKRGARVTASAGAEPMAASWQVGTGQVAAMGFGVSGEEAQRVAERVGREPRDPRVRVSWACGREVSVRVDAGDEQSYLNALPLSLRMGDSVVPIEQTGPGEYAANMTAPQEGMIATVELAGRVVDRRAIAGRYALEFEEIGNDDSALAAIARRTGGRVIGPAERGRIDFAWRARRVDLTSWGAVLGAGMIAVGVSLMRR